MVDVRQHSEGWRWRSLVHSLGRPWGNMPCLPRGGAQRHGGGKVDTGLLLNYIVLLEKGRTAGKGGAVEKWWGNVLRDVARGSGERKMDSEGTGARKGIACKGLEMGGQHREHNGGATPTPVTGTFFLEKRGVYSFISCSIYVRT